MPGTPHEIPTLLIVVPLGLVAFAIIAWSLHRRRALTVMRLVVAAVACVYGAGVIANTLLPIHIGQISGGGPWTGHLNLVPLADTEPADMVMNVLVFLPLGALLPVMFRVDSALRVLLCGFVLSLGMELIQLGNAVTGHGGHIADVNDLLANTLGAPLGYAVFRASLRLPLVARWANAATWPPSRSRARVASAP